MVEVGILEELNSTWVERVLDLSDLCKGAIVLALASEATVAWLEVRAGDVAHGELVESLVDRAA